MTATFDLGNTSGSRKRVTVLLHDFDFSDLSACTFWLPAGQALRPYSMSSFTRKAWTNATISIYAATVDNAPSAQLDNVTLRLTPGTSITGTTCIESGAGGAAPLTNPASSLRSPGSAALSVPAAAESNVTNWLDLSGATRARMVLPARLLGEDSFGEIQITTDGIEWRPILTVGPGDDWRVLDLDLSSWIGQKIGIRLVIRGPAGDEAVWIIDDFSRR